MKEISEEQARSTFVGNSRSFLITKDDKFFLGNEDEWRKHTLTPIDIASKKEEMDEVKTQQ